MKKVLALVLAVVMLLSLALPAAALTSPGASSGDLIPGLGDGVDDYLRVILHTLEEVMKKMSKAIQDLMAEAKEKLPDACPEGFAVKYFFYVEIINSKETEEDDIVSVDFDPIDHNEILFKKYVQGAWAELKHDVKDDGTIVVYGVEESPLAVFTK